MQYTGDRGGLLLLVLALVALPLARLLVRLALILGLEFLALRGLGLGRLVLALVLLPLARLLVRLALILGLEFLALRAGFPLLEIAAALRAARRDEVVAGLGVAILDVAEGERESAGDLVFVEVPTTPRRGRAPRRASGTRGELAAPPAP